ncbi:MAG TPA: type II secretion system F family protein [Candidatus Binatia bacterium]|nr:type II secretion system F family protein [Candidatus Binatia bacterium]
MGQFLYRLSRQFPHLGAKLRQAGIGYSSEQFLRRTLLLTFYLWFGLMLLLGVIAIKLPAFRPILYVVAPVLLVVLFFYLLKAPEVYVARQRREINQELIYAGRFLIVELKSGVLLYDALKTVAKSYKNIGKAFRTIINNVDLGTTLEDALVQAIDFTPSEDLRRVLWQMLNAINTGADVADSLTSVVEQITRQQLIEVNQYARKLNPLAMFYMMIAVIMPSLGVTLIVVLSSFFPISLDKVVLITIAFGLGFLQLIFVAIIKSSRPAVGI